jgi:hypothetical protein
MTGSTWIYPRRAKALTLPIPGQGRLGSLTPAGVKRKEAREFLKEKDVRSFAGYIWRIRKRSKSQGGGYNYIPLFKYVPKVKIPNRPWATKALMDSIPFFELRFASQGFKAIGEYMGNVLEGKTV